MIKADEAFTWSSRDNAYILWEGMLYGSPSIFSVPFLAMSLQRSMQRSLICTIDQTTSKNKLVISCKSLLSDFENKILSI